MRYAVYIFAFALTAANAQLNRDFEPAVIENQSDFTSRPNNLRRNLQSMPPNTYNNPNPTEGPWPECVGWDALTCQEYVDQWVGFSSTQNQKPAQAKLIASSVYEFEENRVWIQCDSQGNVLQTPSRG